MTRTPDAGASRPALPGETRRALEAMLSHFGDREHKDCDCRECELIRTSRAALASEDVQGWRTPEGYALAPVEPTEAMNVAGCKEDDILGELVDWRGENTTTRETVARVYRAMLAAAPPAPETRT